MKDLLRTIVIFAIYGEERREIKNREASKINYDKKKMRRKRGEKYKEGCHSLNSPIKNAKQTDISDIA